MTEPAYQDLDRLAREALRTFGPGTTKGGRAEAGWFEVGVIADNGPTFKAVDDD